LFASASMRPDFAQTMTDEERSIMMKHITYWTEIMNQGKVLAFGPVLDPKSVYGLGIIAVDTEQEVKEFMKMILQGNQYI